MKFKNRALRTICLILTLTIVFVSFGCLSAMAISTEFSIAKGQYIQWGSLSGKPLVWVALENSSDDSDGANTVNVMTKDIVAMRTFNDKDTLPQSWGETALYQWLNSTSGFWSESNFTGNDRYLRAVSYFSIMSGTEFIEYFLDGILSDVTSAKYNGSKRAWWVWGGSAEDKMGYQVSKDGVLEEYYFEDVSKDKAGVRPITTLNLESFYISSGKGTASSPYVISSVYDCDLKSLSVTGCVITPAFSTEKTEYTSNVTSKVEKITLSAVPKDKNATVSIYLNDQRLNITNSSSANTINLNYGENVITVRVLAVDGFSESVYTLKVTRQQADNTTFLTKMQIFDNEPSFDIHPEELKLSPQFSKDVFSYSIDVGRSVKKGKIVIEGKSDAKATIKLNNANEIQMKKEKNLGQTAVFSAEFDVTDDLTLMTVTMSSTDGKLSKKYVANVLHGQKALYLDENAGVLQTEQSTIDEPIDPNDPNNPDDPNNPIDPDGQGDDTFDQSLPLYEEEDGMQWWVILLIALGVIIFIAGIIFAIVQLKNRNKDDELIDDAPYYMGSSSPLKQDLQKEREQAKEVNEFYEVVPRNSQYRGVYDNRPNMNNRDAFSSNDNTANGANTQQRSESPFNGGNAFSQNTSQQNRTAQQGGFYNIYTPQQKTSTQSSSGGQAVDEKHDTDDKANTQSQSDRMNEDKQSFKLDFDADKVYRFNDYSGSSGQTNDIASNSGESENTVSDPVKTFEDRMKFDTDKDIFSSTAKPEDEFGGFMQ